MGQSLEKPIIEKHTSVETNGRLVAACASMQGYRISNEDAHNLYTKVDLSKNPLIQEYLKSKKIAFSFFGIFDGHSGIECSQFLSNNLLHEILSQEESKLASDKSSTVFTEETLKQAFIQTDEKFFKTAMVAGSTAVTTLILSPTGLPDVPSDNKSALPLPLNGGNNNAKKKKKKQIEIVCMNTGDSRCVLYDQGTIIPMSTDHKPLSEKEKKRITNAGSTVQFGRINGSLAVSRAFGDKMYKEDNLDPAARTVTCVPEIKRQMIPFENSKNPKEFRFLLLACDGIWDVLSNKSVCDFIKQKLIEQVNGDYWQKKFDKQMEKTQNSNGSSNFSNSSKSFGNSSNSSNSGVSDQKFQEIKEKIMAGKEKAAKFSGFDLEAICEDVLDHAVLELESKDNVSVVLVLFL